MTKKKIVILGMMSHMPVAGNMWLVLQYLIGFRRLGYDVYYVEAHGINPGMLMKSATDDSAMSAAAFLGRLMERIGLADHWAFQALHADGRIYGMESSQLRELYRTAELIINLHGGTVPQAEHAATGRLVYLETDPVELEVELWRGLENTRQFIAPHTRFFTWGLNYYQPDCLVPMPKDFRFVPTPPPIILDYWQKFRRGPGTTFTTIGNWRQFRPEVKYRGIVYHWSKHLEFTKFLDVPGKTGQSFELALSRHSYTEEDRSMLEAKGWRVRDALSFSTDLDSYRNYVTQSRGEFTVAKDQNVRLRSGWFSERSAQYLAAGRPVITQDTGFGSAIPTGEGLFAFQTMEDIEAAVEAINGDYERHSRAAVELAREYFNYDVVLRRLLEQVGAWPPNHIIDSRAS